MTVRVITIRMDIDRAANTANCTMDITENGRSDFKSTSLQLIAMSRALTRFGSKLLDDAAYCIAEDEKEYLKEDWPSQR